MVEELAALGLVATPQAPVPRTVSAADLSSLPYLTCVIKVRRDTAADQCPSPGCNGHAQHSMD